MEGAAPGGIMHACPAVAPAGAGEPARAPACLRGAGWGRRAEEAAMADETGYESDILGWSEDQAERLRRIARGELPNGVGIDWPNVIEEIEDVGERERRAAMSLLNVALVHALKAHAWPDHRDRRHWLSEAATALLILRRALDPGMRQRLDLAGAYADAREIVGLDEMGGRGPRPLPRSIPLAFDDIVPGTGIGALEVLGRVTAVAEQEGATPR